MPWITAQPMQDAEGGRPWRWWTALIAATLTMISAIILPTIGVGVYLAVAFAGSDPDFETVMAAFISPGPLISLMLAHQTLVVMAVAGLAALARRGWARELFLQRPQLSGKIILATIGGFLAFFAFDAGLAWLDPEALASDAAMVQNMLFSEHRWAAVATAVVGAPLAEEFLFRGFLFPAFARSRIGAIGAAVVTSVLWSGLHAYSWVGSLEIFIAGLGLAWLLQRTQSLWPCIALHAALNAYFCVLTLWPGG